MGAPITDPTTAAREVDPRRDLTERPAVSELDSPDEQWDEVIAIEIPTAPGNCMEPRCRMRAPAFHIPQALGIQIQDTVGALAWQEAAPVRASGARHATKINAHRAQCRHHWIRNDELNSIHPALPVRRASHGTGGTSLG